MNMIAIILQTAGVTLAQSGQLDAAITRFMEADDLLAFYDPQRPPLLATWAVALRQRSLGNGHPVDLDASITVYRRACVLPRWEGRPLHLEGVASALLERFRLGGRESDVDEAVELRREALPPLSTPSLVVLGTVLHVRFSRLGDKADLDAAVRSEYEQARTLLRVPPSDVNHCAVLNHLATALTARFHLCANSDDIQQAVALIRQALESWPVGRPEKDGCIANAATILHERFISIGDPADLDESTALHRHELELRPAPHPERSKSLGNLANTLADRFRIHGRTVDAAEAATLYSSALSLSNDSNSQDTRNLVETKFSAFFTLLNQADMAAGSDVQEAVRLARAALVARTPNESLRCTIQRRGRACQKESVGIEGN
ncbi:hypothetical protein FB451DRAFT_1137397 [Mycena latifolia]|nr:hypothetical protein FB451DRAFT_1137397 [Mycena latifolia]